jgi:nucleoside-diphosphate-sugar epimerase
MNIAITGATGVLGNILYQTLRKSETYNISVFSGDITLQKDVNEWLSGINPDFLFHFAALVPVDQVNKDPFRAYEVNVGGTINLLSALKSKSKKPWLFYASTSHVYKSSHEPLHENSVEDPINLYGTTKLVAEKICEHFADSTNVPVCIGRIFSFYHSSQKGSFLYPTLQKRFQTEDMTSPFKLRGAKCIRDIMNAEDIVALILRLKDQQYSGKINIASGIGITIEDFVRKVYEKPIDIEPLDNDFNCLVADISKLNNLLSV